MVARVAGEVALLAIPRQAGSTQGPGVPLRTLRSHKGTTVADDVIIGPVGLMAVADLSSAGDEHPGVGLRGHCVVDGMESSHERVSCQELLGVSDAGVGVQAPEWLQVRKRHTLVN
jgi:hypothetical protein